MKRPSHDASSPRPAPRGMLLAAPAAAPRRTSRRARLRHRYGRRYRHRHRTAARRWASWRRACAGSDASTPPPTPRTRASRGRAPASSRKFMGTSLTAQLAITRHEPDLQDGDRRRAAGAVHGGSRSTRDVPARHRADVRRAHRRALPADRRSAGANAADGADVPTARSMDPPPGPGRLIEVIGDSITCGYGDLGKLGDADCYPTESHWDTYEAVAARMLGAEVSTIAASGRGVIRNYGGDTTGTMPMLYPLTLTNVSDSGLGLSHRAAGGGDQPRHQRHQQQQGRPGRRVPRHLRGSDDDDPDRTIPTPGSSASSARCSAEPISPPSRATSRTRSTSGRRRAIRRSSSSSMIQAQTTDKFACQYHPNVAENMIMATQLAGELSAKLGLVMIAPSRRRGSRARARCSGSRWRPARSRAARRRAATSNADAAADGTTDASDTAPQLRRPHQLRLDRRAACC